MLNEEKITNLSTKPVLPGLTSHSLYDTFNSSNVTQFEEHSVRIKRGYTLSEWGKLSNKEKALEIALSRIHSSIEAQAIDKANKK